MTKQVDCLLLAAGSSRRMGQPKLLLDVGGMSILEVVLLAHLASSVRRICAVVPGWLDGFHEIVSRQGAERLRFIEVADPCPLSESLKAGWAWLEANTDPDGIMISLADKPLVTTETIDLVVSTFSTSGKRICVPVHDGQRGHPVILGSEFAADIMRMTSDRGAREILMRHASEIEEVEIDTDEILIDVDSLEDMDTIRLRLETHE